jgi:uncharacterized protein
MKKTLRFAIVTAVVLVVLSGVGINYAVDYILPYSPIRPHRCTQTEMANYTPDLLSPAAFTSNWENFDITVGDTIRLKGWYVLSTTSPALGTIIVLHGIGSCKIAMLSQARACTLNGYNCILYDSRAHGESGGINCTYGYYEKHDVSAYIDSALVRHPDSPPFGILGDSFGAAVTIQALAHDERLVCGVAESPFATLREVIHDYFQQMFYLPLNAIPDAALKHSEQIAHFAVDSVHPVDDARRILQPTMIIHGEADSKIAPEYGKRIYANLASPNTELYLIPRAGHDDIAAVGGIEYQKRLAAFFRRYLLTARPPT